jgi:hypothetical protein
MNNWRDGSSSWYFFSVVRSVFNWKGKRKLSSSLSPLVSKSLQWLFWWTATTCFSFYLLCTYFSFIVDFLFFFFIIKNWQRRQSSFFYYLYFRLPLNWVVVVVVVVRLHIDISGRRSYFRLFLLTAGPTHTALCIRYRSSSCYRITTSCFSFHHLCTVLVSGEKWDSLSFFFICLK